MNTNKILKKVLNPLAIISFILNILQTSLANIILGYIYMILFGKDINYLKLLVIIVIACIYFWIVIPLVGYIMENTEAKYRRLLKLNVMEHLIKARKNIENNKGLFLLQQDSEAVSSLYSWPLAIFLQAISAGIISIIILSRYSIFMAFLILMSGVFFIIINLFFQKKLRKIMNDIREWRTERNQFLYEMSNNLRTIKLYSMEEYITNKLTDLNKNLNKYERIYSKLKTRLGIIEGILLESFLTIIVIVYGSYLISIGKMPFNSLLMILQISTGLTFLFSSITSLYRGVQSLLLSKDKINEFICENPIVNIQIKDEDVESINIKDCTLGYDDNIILKDLNLSFDFPNNYVLSGNNGTGKSTILKSIIGVLPPSAGNIMINNYNIYKENILFTNKIGYIPQNTYIFNDTLANNVLLGREISHEILLDIFSYVGLNSYLKKINYDLNYMLNIDSIGLSEGEKKRLAIARALITNPNILLIDEFDSNLDDKSMNFLVDKLSSQYSFIMVTHNDMLKNQFNNINLNAIAIVE